MNASAPTYYPELLPVIAVAFYLAAYLYSPYLFFVLICELFALFERRHEEKKNLYPSLFLLANTCFTITTNAIVLSQTLEFSTQECKGSDGIYPRLYPTLFALCLFWGFLILYTRAATTTGITFENSSWRYRFARYLGMLLTFGMIPWSMIGGYYFTMPTLARATPAISVCYMYEPIAILALEMFLEVVIASIFLFLFVYPLLKQSKLIPETTIKSLLKKVAWKNLYLSGLVIIVGIANLTYMIIGKCFNFYVSIRLIIDNIYI